MDAVFWVGMSQERGKFESQPRQLAPHLPVTLMGLGLELEDPVSSDDFSTVGHGEDDRAAQEETCGTTGHRGAQYCLGPFREWARGRAEGSSEQYSTPAGPNSTPAGPPPPSPTGLSTPPLQGLQLQPCRTSSSTPAGSPNPPLQGPHLYPCRTSTFTPAGLLTPSLQGLQLQLCRAPTSTQRLYQGSVCHLGAWDCQAPQQWEVGIWHKLGITF